MSETDIERLERMVQAHEGAIKVIRGCEQFRKRPNDFTASFVELEADTAALRKAIQALKQKVKSK